jgi:hypothetical protein
MLFNNYSLMKAYELEKIGCVNSKSSFFLDESDGLIETSINLEK